MPVIINADQVKVEEGDGWKQLTLADAEMIGAPAMVARRWTLDPHTHGPELVLGEVAQLLYVIQGQGQAIVNGQKFPLTEESVLWLETGEQYQFVTTDEPIEILQGYAPGEEQ